MAIILSTTKKKAIFILLSICIFYGECLFGEEAKIKEFNYSEIVEEIPKGVNPEYNELFNRNKINSKAITELESLNFEVNCKRTTLFLVKPLAKEFSKVSVVFEDKTIEKILGYPIWHGNIEKVVSSDIDNNGYLDLLIVSGVRGSAHLSGLNNICLILFEKNTASIKELNSFGGDLNQFIDINNDGVFEFTCQIITNKQDRYVGRKTYVFYNLFGIRNGDFKNITSDYPEYKKAYVAEWGKGYVLIGSKCLEEKKINVTLKKPIAWSLKRK